MNDVPNSVLRVHPSAIGYRGHCILVKRDFAKADKRTGFIVTDRNAIINVMPGAAWFETVEQAKEGIDALMHADFNAEHFWEILQPFNCQVGDIAPCIATGSVSKGRWHAEFINGIVTKVWIDSVRPWDGKPKFQLTKLSKQTTT